MQKNLKMKTCNRCGCEDVKEYYMVKDNIWKKYCRGYNMLCSSCLEKHMHRKLTIEDYKKCPANVIHILLKIGFDKKSINEELKSLNSILKEEAK